MKRRDFMVLLGGAAAAWARGARAQSGKPPTIGILGSGTPATQGQWYAAFVRRLRELGWTEGRTVAIEYRWAEGRDERFVEIAAEFVRLKVDIIVTSGNSAIAAAKRATSVIPIVFAVAGDPVGTGLVASLARPGGNITGLSGQHTDTVGKRIQLLEEVVPGLRSFALLVNVANSFAALEMREVQATTRALGFDPVMLQIQKAEHIAPAIESLGSRVQALYVVTDTLINVQRNQINSLALAAGLPTMHSVREYVEAGGLISYGVNFPDLWRRTADLVNKILRGAKPADLPIEQPIKFELVINLKTAKALGLTLPPMLLDRADELIE
jgi:putative ABC transport system substrate-binding protein